MPNNELDNRFATLEALLLKLTEKKPSTIRKLWNWLKPYLVPFLLGMLFGIVAISVFPTHQKAALGGAAVPPSQWTQRSDSPSPSPWNSPLGDWMLEPNDSLSMKISEPPLQANPQADAGQTKSITSSRPLTRRAR